MNRIRTFAVASLLMTVVACQHTQNTYHSACNEPSPLAKLVGITLGGLAGGYGGSHIGQGNGRLAAIGVGAVAGAAVGNALVSQKHNSPGCYTHPSNAVQRALNAPVGQAVKWDDYQYDEQGVSKSISQYRTQQNLTCREYVSDVLIGGRRETVYGTACLQPDGQWRIVQ